MDKILKIFENYNGQKFIKTKKMLQKNLIFYRCPRRSRNSIRVEVNFLYVQADPTASVSILTLARRTTTIRSINNIPP